MYQIRKAEERDLPALLAIYNDEVLHSTATFDLNPKTMEERRPWLDAHNRDNHPLIVYEQDGVCAGYASLSPYREKEAFAATVELSIYVAAGYRRQGIASALMEAILQMARDDERTHLVVSVITGGNEASQKLHDRFGFTFCGNIPEVGVKFGRQLSIDNYYLKV